MRGDVLVGRSRSTFHTCALVCLCQTMMSSLDPPSKAGEPGQTLHSRCQTVRTRQARQAGILLFPRDREVGGARRDRTDDLMLAKHALYQLSYGPLRVRYELVSVPGKRLGMVGPDRLELSTLRLSGVRSNHLSYGPLGGGYGSAGPIFPKKGEPDGLAIAPARLKRRRARWKEKRRRRRPAPN
jgi:hypothetical protein